MDYTTDLILVTGMTGSGKTTLSNLLGKNRNITKISLDWFYKDLPENIDTYTYNFDDPNALDWNQVKNTIYKLLNNQYISISAYDFTTHKHNTNIPKIQLRPNPRIVLEGVFAACDPQLNLIAKKIIYISTDNSLCLSRRIKRDINERGRNLEFVLHQWNTFVYPSFKKYVEPQQYHEKSVIVYNNTESDLQNIDVSKLFQSNI